MHVLICHSSVVYYPIADLVVSHTSIHSCVFDVILSCVFDVNIMLHVTERCISVVMYD